MTGAFYNILWLLAGVKLAEKPDLNNVVEEYEIECDDSIPDNDNLPGLTDYKVICDFEVLANELDKCVKCGMPLRLSRTLYTKHYGLGCELFIECDNGNCDAVTKVSTSKKHHNLKTKRGKDAWDLNTKMAAGMIHCGIGETQTNNFLSSMNLHCISTNALKNREHEVGKAIDDLTEQSINRALENELKATTSAEESDASQETDSDNELEQNGTISNKQNQQNKEKSKKKKKRKKKKRIRVSGDGGYQRRGSGRCYNSLTGHATLMGRKLGKVVGLGIRYKRCRKCKSKKPKPHPCPVNFSGSAKAMESDILVELLKDCKEKGAPVGEFCGDDDTTTIYRARREVDPEIKKSSDKNHVSKNIGKDLHAIKSQHKELTERSIAYLQKNFNYMLSQNKGSVDGIRQGLKAVVHHSFAEHEYCTESWCGYLKDPENYKHKTLKKDLESPELKKELLIIFENRPAEKLANLGSTQGNESLNNTNISKAEKRKHYGSSPSLGYRLKAGTLQKNEGHSYVPQVKIFNSYIKIPG